MSLILWFVQARKHNRNKVLRQAGSELKKIAAGAAILCMCLMIAACSDFKSDGIMKKEDRVLESERTSEADNRDDALGENNSDTAQERQDDTEMYTRNTKITDVINDEAFDHYGRLFFPGRILLLQR